MSDTEWKAELSHGKSPCLVFDDQGNGPLDRPVGHAPTEISVSSYRSPLGWRICVAIEPFMGGFVKLDGAEQIHRALGEAIERARGQSEDTNG